MRAMMATMRWESLTWKSRRAVKMSQHLGRRAPLPIRNPSKQKKRKRKRKLSKSHLTQRLMTRRMGMIPMGTTLVTMKIAKPS